MSVTHLVRMVGCLAVFAGVAYAGDKLPGNYGGTMHNSSGGQIGTWETSNNGDHFITTDNGNVTRVFCWNDITKTYVLCPPHPAPNWIWEFTKTGADTWDFTLNMSDSSDPPAFEPEGYLEGEPL